MCYQFYKGSAISCENTSARFFFTFSRFLQNGLNLIEKKMLIMSWTSIVYALKVILGQNEFIKSSILQNSDWKIWRISALASKLKSNKKILIFSFSSIFLIGLFSEAWAEILQIFQLLFCVNWRFHEFIPT